MLSGTNATSIIVVGAGGFSREAAQAVLAAAAAGAPQKFLGFVDDDPRRAGTLVDGLPVLGTIDQVVAYAEARLVVGVGRPDNYVTRFRIVERLALARDRYTTVVHPDASLAERTELGPGSVVLAGTVTTASVRIGSHVALMPGVVLTHDDAIDDFATITAGVRLGGDVHVGTGAYVGSGALVREGITIGPWAMIGMGSVVTRDVPAGELWFGAPAKYHRAAPVPAELVERTLTT